MTWTVPRTFTVGEVLTSAVMNVHVRDNLDALGGAAKPNARVRSNTDIAMPNATVVALTFNTVSYNVGTLWSAGAPTRLTVPSGWGGKWLIGANAKFSESSNGYAHMRIIYNATEICGMLEGTRNGVAGGVNKSWCGTQIALMTLWHAVAGDFFIVEAFQNSGAAGTLVGAATDPTMTNRSPYFWAEWVAV